MPSWSAGNAEPGAFARGARSQQHSRPEPLALLVRPPHRCPEKPLGRAEKRQPPDQMAFLFPSRNTSSRALSSGNAVLSRLDASIGKAPAAPRPALPASADSRARPRTCDVPPPARPPPTAASAQRTNHPAGDHQWRPRGRAPAGPGHPSGPIGQAPHCDCGAGRARSRARDDLSRTPPTAVTRHRDHCPACDPIAPEPVTTIDDGRHARRTLQAASHPPFVSMRNPLAASSPRGGNERTSPSPAASGSSASACVAASCRQTERPTTTASRNGSPNASTAPMPPVMHLSGSIPETLIGPRAAELAQSPGTNPVQQAECGFLPLPLPFPPNCQHGAPLMSQLIETVRPAMWWAIVSRALRARQSPARRSQPAPGLFQAPPAPASTDASATAGFKPFCGSCVMRRPPRRKTTEGRR